MPLEHYRGDQKKCLFCGCLFRDGNIILYDKERKIAACFDNDKCTAPEMSYDPKTFIMTLINERKKIKLVGELVVFSLK